MGQVAFWHGAIAMLLAIIVVFGVGGWLVKKWNDVLQFFHPTEGGKLPGPGPSGLTRFFRCCGALFWLGFFFLVLIGAIYWGMNS